MNTVFEKYFNSLAGSWSLERVISTGEILNGKAEFETLSGSAFLMQEEGVLLLKSGATIPASRNWFWHLKDQAILEITYDEEKLQDYHRMSVLDGDVGWSGSAEHLCGVDLYSGEYKFFEDGFAINQTVKGPQKDYSVASIYKRIYSK